MNTIMLTDEEIYWIKVILSERLEAINSGIAKNDYSKFELSMDRGILAEKTEIAQVLDTLK